MIEKARGRGKALKGRPLINGNHSTQASVVIDIAGDEEWEDVPSKPKRSAGRPRKAGLLGFPSTFIPSQEEEIGNHKVSRDISLYADTISSGGDAAPVRPTRNCE